VTAVVELVRAMGAAGLPAAIAVPAGHGRSLDDVKVVECRGRAVPFGPMLRLPPREPHDGVLHVHGIATLTPWSAFWPRRWAGPVVASMHGTLDWRLRHPLRGLKALWHRRLDVPLLHRLDGIHVTRASEAEAIDGVGVPAGRATEIPWTVGDEPPLPAGTTSAPPYVVAVGRLHPIKGLDRLLEAFAVVARRHPTARLRVAGAGPRAEADRLAEHARRLGFADRLDVTGLLDRDALRRMLTDAAALALPSLYENFGMVVLEALREGCPVVASRETPWGSLEETRAGRWVDFADPEAAAAALLDSLVPAARAATSAAARGLYEARFTPGVVVPRFAAWYASVVRAFRAGAAA
jgi:glycosyltransferase involved in cell wall biosynthesis